MLYRDQIKMLRTIASKGIADVDEVARSMRRYGVNRDAIYVYLGRLRKKGLVDTTYRQRGSSRFALFSVTMLGIRVIDAWLLLQAVSPAGWPYGKKRNRRRKMGRA